MRSIAGRYARLRSRLHAAAPWLAGPYLKVKEALLAARAGRSRRREVFSGIYRTQAWGSPESVSGPGSTLAATERLRGTLPALLASLEARSLLDAPCGDFHWMQHVPLALEYIGVDIVPELIAENVRRHSAAGRSFQIADIARARLPRVDVILCRDCLIHLPLRAARAVVRNLQRSGSRYLLTTHYEEVTRNCEILTGQWRPLNLCRPPFRFPPPLRTIEEDRTLAKVLGLWRLADL